MAKPYTLNANLLSTNWSGAVIPAVSGQSFGTVSAEWVVPEVSQVPIDGATLTDAAEWVGLDGYQSNDVCQAGVLETVQTAANGETTVSCTAWDEWYPNSANMISSSAFTVDPGDTVKVTVETLGAGATRATFLFDDVTTGQTYDTSLTAPTGVSLQGNSAEIIVETPELISGTSVSQPLLTDFVGSPVVFQEASATYANGTSASLSSALPTALVSDSVPGSGGSYVQEAYGSVQPGADTVTVTEDPYWTSSDAGTTMDLPANASYTDTQSGVTLIGGGGTTSVDLQSASSVFVGDTGTDQITVTGSNNTVIAGGGDTTVDADAGSVLVLGDSGSLLLNAGAGAATLDGGTGPITVAGGQGAAPLVFDGAAPLFFSGGSGAATVVGGTGAETIFANGGGQFWGGSGSMFFVGGSGVSTVVGGSGSSTLFGGSSGQDLLVAGTGPTTIIGANGNAIVGLGSNPDVLISGGGNETLVGSAQGGADTMVANTGNDAMFGGTGNDIFVASSGNSQMIAGPGQDLFVFSNGNAGGSAVICNFVQGQDAVGLFGYAPNVGQSALNSAVSTAGSTTITLPDNTRITFADVTHLSANDFVSG